MVGTGTLEIDPSTAFHLIPGLSTQVTVPEGGFVYLTTSGGVELPADGGATLVRIVLFVNNSPVNAGIADLMAVSASGQYTTVRWNLSTVVKWPSGTTYNVAVRVQSYYGNKRVYVSGNQSDGSGRQGSLTALVLKQ